MYPANEGAPGQFLYHAREALFAIISSNSFGTDAPDAHFHSRLPACCFAPPD
jgi:hypothetical protein